MNTTLIRILIMCSFLLSALSNPAFAIDDTPLSKTANESTKTVSTSESQSPKKETFFCDSDHNPTQRPILFTDNSSTFDPAYIPLLKLHAECLNSHPHLRLTLSGNTDLRKSAELALVIGQKRAEAVQKQLLGLGVSPTQIESITYGKERPFVSRYPRDSMKGRQLDRRVDFTYIELK